MKLNFHPKNTLGSPILTIIGTVAAIALPYLADHVDPTTVGGAVVIAVVGALAGVKRGE